MLHPPPQNGSSDKRLKTSGRHRGFFPDIPSNAYADEEGLPASVPNWIVMLRFLEPRRRRSSKTKPIQKRVWLDFDLSCWIQT